MKKVNFKIKMIRRIGTLNLNGAKQEKRQKLLLRFFFNDEKIDLLCEQELDTNNFRRLEKE